MDSRPAWAPDGAHLAYVRDAGTDTSIVERDLKSGKETVLVSTPAIDLDPVHSHDGGSLYYSSAESGAISTDILEFRARVLVMQAVRGGYGRAALIPDTVLPVYSGDRAIRLSRAVAYRRTGPPVPVVGCR